MNDKTLTLLMTQAVKIETDSEIISNGKSTFLPAGSIVLSPEHFQRLVRHAGITQKGDAAEFIAAYITAYRKRYGEASRPDISGKVQGEIKRLLKDVPVQRACNLVQVYLQMDTPWFKIKCYDITTFCQNLNPIGLALDTGMSDANSHLDFSWMKSDG